MLLVFFSNLHIFMIYIYTYIQNIYRQQFIGQKKSETKRETQNLNTKQKMIYTHIYMYIKLYIYIDIYKAYFRHIEQYVDVPHANYLRTNLKKYSTHRSVVIIKSK